MRLQYQILPDMAVNLSTQQALLEELVPYHATLVAVSKTKPASDIQELYNAGQRDFGENYVQELLEKQAQLPSDIRWHFIGHLQRNKVKQIVPFIYLIQGVDTLRLLEEINKQATAAGRIVQVLLQVYIASEETKFGMDEQEVSQAMKLYNDQNLSHVHIRGLMGMASFTNDTQKVKQEFQNLQHLFTSYRDNNGFDILSMGMTADYKLALNCGSNMIRIGSALFGSRN